MGVQGPHVDREFRESWTGNQARVSKQSRAEWVTSSLELHQVIFQILSSFFYSESLMEHLL